MMNNNKPAVIRVFALEPYERHPTLNADTFGDIVYLTDCRRPKIWSDEFEVFAINELLKYEYVPHRDFILASGPLVAISAFITAIASRYGTFQALLFDSKDKIYKYRVLGLYGSESEWRAV